MMKVSWFRRNMDMVFHVLFLAVTYGFWISFAYKRLTDPWSVIQLLLYASTYVGVFYFNAGVLIPKLFFKGKYIAFIGVTVLSFLISYLVQQFIYLEDYKDLKKHFALSGAGVFVRDIIINQFTHILFCAVGLAFKMTGLWVRNVEQINELRSSALSSELQLLKSQLSPHFLFNTLNNLYVLTRSKPDKASEMILELSDLLRFQIHESTQDKISLDKELAYIQSYLHLEGLRKEKIEIQIPDPKNYKHVKIVPLLLFTLVENAVKHGVQPSDVGFVSINIEFKENHLKLLVSNSKMARAESGTKLTQSGTGLTNLKKRLELCYPDKHQLDIHDTHDTYEAILKIDLS